jgi:hypothetical protein
MRTCSGHSVHCAKAKATYDTMEGKVKLNATFSILVEASAKIVAFVFLPLCTNRPRDMKRESDITQSAALSFVVQ